MQITEECRHQSAASKGLHPPVHPAVIYARRTPTHTLAGSALRRDWLDDYFTSHIHQELSRC